MWLMENWSEVGNHDIENVASDIATRALEAAAEGVYGAHALMRLSRDVIDRYFEHLDDGQVRIDPGLRESVQFTRANLIDARDMALYRNFDIVFCRNVLIYFDDASRRIAAENLYDCLNPGGYICLGHSETMSRISPLFDVCRFPEAIVYQGRRRTMTEADTGAAGRAQADPGDRRLVAGPPVLPRRARAGGLRGRSGHQRHRGDGEGAGAGVRSGDRRRQHAADGRPVVHPRAAQRNVARRVAAALVVTTEAGQQDREDARAAGANFYIVKPVSEADLLRHAAVLTGAPP